MNLNGFAKKLFAAWMVIFFTTTPILGARVAHAGMPVFVDGDLQAFGLWLKDAVGYFLKSTLQAAVVTAVINGLSFAADRLAYDAAVSIATGGNAEEPLFDGTENETYLGMLVTGAVGEAIGSMSEKISGAGGLLSNFNLCAPSSPYILLQFKLGIKGVFDRPEPKCDFNKMFGPEGTWAAFGAELAKYKDPVKNQLILAELANMYDPAKSEFGAGLQVSTDIFGKAMSLPLLGVQKKIQDGGFKDVVDFITGNVETPADILSTQVKDAQKASGDTRQQATLAMLANGEVLLQIGVHAASVFTNTLISKLQERMWQGMFDFDTVLTDPFDPDSFALNTTEDAAEHYRSLLTAAPFQISNYSILSEFITCPGSDLRGLYNCVADSNFVSAVAREEAGAPLTISEAIEEGLVDGEWPLIPASDVARNQDAFCYTYGFCYGNLVKLRKARVISIGWELAASSSSNSAETPVTLQEVINGFNSCGSDGLPDDNHPWCKMIDPDWVLKYPETQCRMQVNGELLLTDQADGRAQVCVDMPSCIGEDADGNCTGGYGYCVAEENTWRFRGESCPEYAASCLTFEDSEGNSSSLLRNTVDPGPCTEDTVGCRWYATEKTEQDDGSYEYAAVSSIADANADDETYASRIYFNNQIEECDEEEGGCSTLIERDVDLRLNAVYNPSFEIDEDADDSPDGWYDYHILGSSWPSEIANDTGYQREGDVAVSPGEASTGLGALYQPGIELGQARTYTLSFYARQLAAGDADTASVVLDLHDEDGTSIDVSGLAITGDCNDSYTNIFGSVVSTGIGIEAVTPGSDAEYDRFTCIFTVPPLADTSLRVYGDLIMLNFDGYIDSVQLEQGEDVSAAVDGYSDTDYTTKVVKVAPAYLGCTGSEDDPEECDSYAQVCSEQDMGCTLYTPINGDPAISGVATELDECPSECAGYDTYRQEATLYEPDGVDSVYFIPDTANTCTAEEVGCDEFTNLATEEQEYYSFMRACVTEAQALANISSDNEATYYTWEGSDEDGYQLRTWALLESNAGSSDYTQIGADGVTDTAPDLAPCSNWVTSDDGITCNDTADTDGDGYYDWDTEDCSARADIFTNANCREFYDESGNIHYRDWENSVTVNNACQSYRKTTLAGDTVTEQEATCEDSGGYYVSDSGECRYYGYAEESTSCDESANGCRAYAGGRSRNSRLVLEELFEGGTLNQWDAASAASATYSNESLAAEGHSMLLTGAVTSFIAGSTTVCTDTDGCSEAALSFGGECTVSEGGTYCGTLDDELYAGKTYTVSVVAKGTGTLQLGFDYNATPSAPAIDLAFGSAVDLDDGWQIITLGPLIMDAEDYPLFGDGTSLVLVPTGTAYVDNIVLREGEESLNVIRDSWVTPASCDESVTGDYSAQYYLGCQEYSDQDGETAYLKSLSSLCDEDKVGCDAFFKTQESESTTAQTFNATCNNVDADASGDPDVATSATACYYFYASTATYDTESPYLCTISTGETSCLFSTEGFTPSWKLGSTIAVSYGPETVITSADQDMFLVVTDDFECDNDVAGCTELGDPQWSQDRNSTDGADSIYLMNLPDTYDDILCAHEELFCDAFTANDASTYYFKSPLEQLCEYRTDVTIDGTVYNGWFREGTDSFCYGTCEDTATGTVEGEACGSSADCTSTETCNAGNPSYVIGGTESGIWNNGDDEFGSWAGTCAATYDTCTEFQDKLAQDDGEIYGETDGTSYFYLNNDSLSEYGLSDSQKCDGQVSLKNGCAMFYDTGDTSITANSSATEIASRHADDIFGSEPYGLVDPIDCENGGDTTLTTVDGTEIDLCATRCAYDYGEVYDLTDGVTYQDKLDLERASSDDYSRDEMYVFGGSCYDSTDCPLVTSESGANVEAVSCATQVRVDPFSGMSSFGGSFSSWSSRTATAGFDEVPRQENDVNAPLKVNRNRSCAEWLSCAQTNTQWDDATASFVTSCSEIRLCKDYDAATGTSFCSDWDTEKPDVIYDTEWYASRDTSWYGNEYSGMAIPNLFPVQSLTQADVSPTAYCNVGGELWDEVCEVAGDACGPAGSGECLNANDAIEAGIIDDLDYALVLDAGSCEEDDGEICSVGYCEENGAACATSEQCSDGPCIVGACYTVGTDASDVCQTAADCDEGQTCYGGACSDVGIDVEIEDYETETATATSCTSSETFVANAAMKLGSCINEQCLLTPDGETYEDGTTEGKICRAYPESTSPFPNEVVDDWYDPTNAGSVDTSPSGDAMPYDMLSGFENVETCAYGEDCDCSYAKVTFGEGADTRFYNMDWSVDFSICGGSYESFADAGEVCTESADCSSGSCVNAAGQLGLCQSGDRAGGYCTENEQCGDDTVGSCSKTTREDVVYGLNGFCLEKDTSINILGDREKQACLSWLPVDELAGDTDLQAKYTGAGYFRDVYMCTDIRPFVNVQMSAHEHAEYRVACAESDGVGNYKDVYGSGAECNSGVRCPDGFFAILGSAPYNNDAAEGELADFCSQEYDTAFGDNDCPFVCVPEDSSSYNEETGEYETSVCEPGEYSWAWEDTGGGGTSVYYVGNALEDEDDDSSFQAFDNRVSEFADCDARGVRAANSSAPDPDLYSDLTEVSNYPRSDTSDDDESSTDGYRSLRFHDNSFGSGEDSFYEYAGCAAVTQVASAEESYAWTDRVRNGYSLITSNAETAFNELTTPDIFGAVSTNPQAIDPIGSVMKVAQCDDGGTDVQPTSGSSFTECPSGYAAHESGSADPTSASLQARALINFTYDYLRLVENTEDAASTTWTPSDIWAVEPSATATDETFSLITQVFASVWNSTTWFWNGEFNPGSASRGYVNEEDTNEQFLLDEPDMDVRPAEGAPPTIWAVNTQSCSDDGLLCEEGTEGRITVNSEESGDQSGSEFFNATVKFYAAADKNQLPIRRVFVDWGDDLDGGSYTGSEADDNYFKNSRGLQDGTQNSKCDLETDWGLTDESCDPYYFKYSHIYTCSSEILRDSTGECSDSPTDDDDDYDSFPCWLDQSGDEIADACVFQPRVYVRDNWGWCTGSCDSTADTSDTSDADYPDNTGTCYDYDGSLSGVADSTDECKYTSTVYEPWVNYTGVIIVTP